jgi:hypothetical protein
VSFPEGHKLTSADVDTIMAALNANGFTSGLAADVAIRNVLNTEVGQPWNKAMQDRLAQKFGAAAVGMPSDLGKALGVIGDAVVPAPLKDAAKVAGDIGAFLFDVENWKYLGAIIVGVPLALIGFYLLAGVPTGGRNA